MKKLRDKINSIDLILENEILFNELILECENNSSECNINIKEIKRKSYSTKLDFISALKIASFVFVCIFLWEIVFSNINLTYAKDTSIVKNENVSNFSKDFKKFTENFKIFERR